MFKNSLLSKFSCFSGCTKKKDDYSVILSPFMYYNVKYAETVPFVPPVKQGVVIKVYDGDTITIASRLPIIPIETQPIYRFSVRLNGIDTPEIKGKDDDEKQCAQRAKEYVSKMVMGKLVTLEDVQLEKYGRLLATVLTETGENLNELMVNCRYAVKYDGGTKVSPVSWQKYYDTGELE